MRFRTKLPVCHLTKKFAKVFFEAEESKTKKSRISSKMSKIFIFRTFFKIRKCRFFKKPFYILKYIFHLCRSTIFPGIQKSYLRHRATDLKIRKIVAKNPYPKGLRRLRWNKTYAFCWVLGLATIHSAGTHEISVSPARKISKTSPKIKKLVPTSFLNGSSDAFPHKITGLPPHQKIR